MLVGTKSTIRWSLHNSFSVNMPSREHKSIQESKNCFWNQKCYKPVPVRRDVFVRTLQITKEMNFVPMQSWRIVERVAYIAYKSETHNKKYTNTNAKPKEDGSHVISNERAGSEWVLLFNTHMNVKHVNWQQEVGEVIIISFFFERGGVIQR
jgi:hypothetical protein